MHYSSYFKIPHRELIKVGIFDGLIERDIPLHVDPMLLKGCKIPEFEGSYQKFLDYFNEIVTLGGFYKSFFKAAMRAEPVKPSDVAS